MASAVVSAGQSITRLITRSAIATLVVMLVSVSVLLAEHQVLLKVTQQFDPALSANRQVLQSMTESQSAVRGYLLTGETVVLLPYQMARQPLADSFTTLQKSPIRDIAGLAQQQRQAANNWLFNYAAPFIRSKTKPSNAQLDAARQAFSDFTKINTEITTTLRASRDGLSRRSTLVTGLAVAVLVGVSLLTAGFLVGRGRRSLQEIGPPLAGLQEMLLSRRAGDLTRRADTDVGVSEVRAVAGAINQMITTADVQRTLLAEELRLAEGIRQLGVTISARIDVADILEAAAGELAIALRTHVIWLRAFSGEGLVPGVGAGKMYPSRAGFTTSRGFVAQARKLAPLALARKTACLLTPDAPEHVGFIERADGEALLASIKQSTGSENLLFVGLGVGVECLGYIGMSRGPGAPAWSAAEQAAAVLAGQQVGQAILNGRLFQREQQLVDEFKALDERKNDFVSTVSHELRTPLASILGYLELIRAGDLGEVTPGVGQSLNAIDRNSRRLQLLIEDLLLLSQVEERDLHPFPLELDALVLETLADRKAARRPRADDLVLNVEGPLPIAGEQRELARVVDNLVDNAIKFSTPGSKIIVTARIENDQACLSVRDHGIGLSVTDQAMMFRRFYRSAEATNRALPGTGLGLSIVKMIIDKHQGTIEVESEAGVGTTMIIRLPLRRGAGRLPANRTCSQPQPAIQPTAERAGSR